MFDHNGGGVVLQAPKKGGKVAAAPAKMKAVFLSLLILLLWTKKHLGLSVICCRLFSFFAYRV